MMHSTHITIADVLRSHTTMTPKTLAFHEDGLSSFSLDEDTEHISEVFNHLHLTIGLMNAWLGNSQDSRASLTDDIRVDNDTYSRSKMTLALTRIINEIHKENNCIMADTVQYLLRKVSGAVISELSHGYIEYDDFSYEFLLTYDLDHYDD